MLCVADADSATRWFTEVGTATREQLLTFGDNSRLQAISGRRSDGQMGQDDGHSQRGEVHYRSGDVPIQICSLKHEAGDWNEYVRVGQAEGQRCYVYQRRCESGDEMSVRDCLPSALCREVVHLRGAALERDSDYSSRFQNSSGRPLRAVPQSRREIVVAKHGRDQEQPIYGGSGQSERLERQHPSTHQLHYRYGERETQQPYAPDCPSEQFYGLVFQGDKVSQPLKTEGRQYQCLVADSNYQPAAAYPQYPTIASSQVPTAISMPRKL